MLHWLSLLWPWPVGSKLSCSGIFPYSLRTHHTRSSGWMVRGWTFVLYLLYARSLVASSLILSISWSLSIVSSSTHMFSLFCCSWKNNLFVDGSSTSTGIMVFVSYVSRKWVSLVVDWGEQCYAQSMLGSFSFHKPLDLLSLVHKALRMTLLAAST